jgi:hypothetical protein
MSELAVGSLKGLAANDFKIDVAPGSQIVQHGSILQVVSTIRKDAFTQAGLASGATSNDLITCSITPISASSKILVAGLLVAVSGGSNPALLVPYRNGSTLDDARADAVGSRTRTHGGPQTASTYSTGSLPINFLDSPNTTLPLTYSIRVVNTSGSSQTLFVNRSIDDSDAVTWWRGTSTLTLMEVAS